MLLMILIINTFPYKDKDQVVKLQSLVEFWLPLNFKSFCVDSDKIGNLRITIVKKYLT